MKPPALESEARSAIVRTAYRGRHAKELIKREIWREITSHLADEQISVAAAGLWNGQKSSDETALRSAFQSGRYAEIENLVKLLDRWIREGHEAEDKLKELGIQI